MSFVPGQPVLAVAGNEKLALLREVGGELKSLPATAFGRAANSDSVAVRKLGDGRWLLAAGGSGRGVWVYRLTTGHLGTPSVVERVTGLPASTATLGFSGTRRLVLADRATGLFVWDPDSTGAKPRRVAARYAAAPSTLAVGPGVAAVIAGSPGSAWLWRRFPAGRPERVCGDGSPSALAFDSSGTLLACGMSDGTVSLWDVQSGQLLGPPLRGQSRGVVSLAFEPGTSLLAVAAGDGTVALWDTKTFLRAHHMSEGLGSHVTDAVFRRDGKVVVLTRNRALEVGTRRTADAMPPAARTGRAWQYKLVTSADGRRLLFVQIVGNLASGDLLPLRMHLGPDLSEIPDEDASISDRGEVVAIASTFANAVVHRWGPGWKRRPSLVPPKRFSSPQSVAISADGRRVAAFYTSAGRRGVSKVVLWSSGAGLPRRTVLDGGAATVYDLLFSPDGSVLVGSGDKDGTIELWHVGGSPTPQVLRGHAGTVTDVAFTPDGRLMASGGVDGTVRLWDPEAGGAELGDPIDVGGQVAAVAFSPDGRRLLAVHGEPARRGFDGQVSVWDVTRWQQADDDHADSRLQQLADRLCATVWPTPSACTHRPRPYG